MGTSGTGIFADDVACDVRDQFIELLAAGTSASEASSALQELWNEAIADSDDGPVFWLALAATQWKYGVLAADVRDRALEVIASGANLTRWTGAAATQRARVLAELQRQLESPQPAPRRPRRRRQIPPPLSHHVISPDGRCKATIWENAPRDSPWAPSSQVIYEFDAPNGSTGGHLCLFNAYHDQVVLTWVAADTLTIGYPATVTLTRPTSSFGPVSARIHCRYEVLPTGSSSVNGQGHR
jgi:hypothetical protein